MTTEGYVIGPDKKPLASASVYLVDASGKPLGPGVKADEEGYFKISHDLIGKPNVLIKFSYAGYSSEVLSPEDVYDAWEVTLTPAYAEQEAAVVTAVIKKKKIPKKQNYTWVYVLGGTSLALTGFLIYKKFFV
jgi:hypothetical protein